MGWREVKGKLIGDEPVELMRTCLQEVVERFQVHLERQPNVDALVEHWRSLLNDEGHDLLPDLKGRYVAAIILKAKTTEAKEKSRKKKGDS